MKGQQLGILATKQKALDHLVESERTVKIKVEPGTEEVSPAKRHTYLSALRTWPRAFIQTKQVRFCTPCSKGIDTS
jgi:hypothetical protein